jgi:hypothetical protein
VKKLFKKHFVHIRLKNEKHGAEITSKKCKKAFARKIIQNMLSSIYKTLGAWGQCYKTFSVSDLQIFLLSKSVCLTRPEKLSNDNHSSLLQKSLIYVKKSFKHFALHYKTFHCSIISCVIIS